MREKIKTGISILIIILLLPYVAAVLGAGSMKGTEEAAEGQGLEEYVRGILPGQMDVAYEEEALKAQAVIVRTNLLYKSMEFYGKEEAAEAAAAIREEDLEAMGFRYYSRMELEELWGYDRLETYEGKLRRAAADTAGKILALEGKPVDLPYHAVSAGRTRDGEVLGEAYSYLESVECFGDTEASGYLKIQTLDMKETPEILSRDEAGYVTEIRVEGEKLTGEAFRSRYGLPSSCFTVQEGEEGIRAVAKGLGHGLGLSMYQANQMALEGSGFLEILMYFYKNVECISIS